MALSHVGCAFCVSDVSRHAAAASRVIGAPSAQPEETACNYAQRANMHALFLSEVGREARAAQAHVEREQMACHLTHTTAATHALIEANLAETPVYGGWVDAAGPRYCPSIEDKIVRFADKASHQARLHPTRVIRL